MCLVIANVRVRCANRKQGFATPTVDWVSDLRGPSAARRVRVRPLAGRQLTAKLIKRTAACSGMGIPFATSAIRSAAQPLVRIAGH